MTDKVQPKRCTACKREINLNDPHTEYLGHKYLCFKDYSFNPTNCDACQQVLAGYKADDKVAKTIFVERIVAMRRSIRHAMKTGKHLPEEFIERFRRQEAKKFSWTR